LHQIADENNVDLTILSAHGYSGDTRCLWQRGAWLYRLRQHTAADLQDLPTNRIEANPGGDRRP